VIHPAVSSPACRGVAGNVREHPVSGAVLVSRMPSPDRDAAGVSLADWRAFTAALQNRQPN
jgi:hypothetical protein